MSKIKDQATLTAINQKTLVSTNIALVAPVPLKKYRKQFAASFCKNGLLVASKHPLVQLEMRKNRTKSAIMRFLVKVRNTIVRR